MSQEPTVPRIKIRQYDLAGIPVTFAWDSVARDMGITINSNQASLRKGNAYEGDVLHALNEAIWLYTKEISG